jgi:hypothetical protein
MDPPAENTVEGVDPTTTDAEDLVYVPSFLDLPSSLPSFVPSLISFFPVFLP